eukprot:939061-Pyramimonas_sp.AAC.1
MSHPGAGVALGNRSALAVGCKAPLAPAGVEFDLGDQNVTPFFPSLLVLNILLGLPCLLRPWGAGRAWC